MNIGGLLTRSFGIGPASMNRAEADALESMRNQQRFRDEEEARRRRAETEALALGATRKDYSIPLPEMPGDGIRAFAPTVTPAPAAPVAGVAPAGAGAAPAAPVSTILETGPTAGDQIRTSTRLGVVGERNAVNAQVQVLDRDIAKLTSELATLAAQVPKKSEYDNFFTYGGALARGKYIEEKAAKQKAELAKLVKTRDAWVSRSKELDKTLSAGRGVAAPAAAPVAGTAAGLPDGQFENFAQAVMMAESGGNPKAVSSTGALGRMQVMPSTLAKVTQHP